MRRTRHVRSFVTAVALLAALLAACDDGDGGTIRLYTSVTESTVTAVVDEFEARTGIDVEVFRAPTGELAARIAAEQREGGIQADVLWLTDPLSMQQYAVDEVLQVWQPDGAAAIADAYKTDRFWGTRILSMVIVQRTDVEPLSAWRDLTAARYAGRIAAPDPGFAGSAFAVLGFFAADPGFGIEFYEELHANGLVVVNAPGDVVTGVAEGRFDAGITLDFSARAALDKGSPVAIVWPDPGAIALYSPIGVVDGAGGGAEQFTEFVISRPAQELIAATGWQPILTDVPWEVRGEQVTIDWSVVFDLREELLAEYRAIVDG